MLAPDRKQKPTSTTWFYRPINMDAYIYDVNIGVRYEADAKLNIWQNVEARAIFKFATAFHTSKCFESLCPI